MLLLIGMIQHLPRTRLGGLALLSSLVFVACEEGPVYPGGETVRSITIDPPVLTLTVPDGVTLGTILANKSGLRLPALGLAWSSSATDVATVDSTGFVRAVGEGTATISVTAGEQTGTSEVTVVAPAPPDWAEHVCGAASTGQAWCWGRGVGGALGTGDRLGSNVPRAVAAQGGFASVSMGGDHTCALDGGGLAWCWGRGSEGQLGNGGTQSSLVPVANRISYGFSKVSAGSRHTCGLSPSGEVRCWGWNQDGQLGNDTRVDVGDPILLASGLHFLDVSAGGRHSCGVATDHSIWCWGANDRGQLGSTGVARSLVPRKVSAAGVSFIAVSAGTNHTCALDTEKKAWCWGANRHAQLGLGTLDDQPVPTRVSIGLQYQEISAGLIHTCGLQIDGRAYCWGEGVSGQLGDGSGVLKGNPTPVGNESWSSIGVAATTTCAVRGSDGAMYCWGGGGSGELGAGGYGPAMTPVPVAGDHVFRRVGR